MKRRPSPRKSSGGDSSGGDGSGGRKTLPLPAIDKRALAV